MQQLEKDGDLANVKQELLELCKDANAWREQRRQAMKSRIFAQNSSRKDNYHIDTQHFLPKAYENIEIHKQQEQMSRNCSNGCHHNCAISTRESTLEKYIVEQLQTHKRKREATSMASAEVKSNYCNSNQIMCKEPNSVNVFHSQSSSAAKNNTTQQLSLKEKLLQKYATK